MSADEAPASNSPQPVTEKLDDPPTTPGDVAEVSRTNGNGNARNQSEDEEEDDEEEDGEDDNDDDDDDDEEEEEEEPSLKYERMGGAIGGLLKKDSASALAVTNKCLVGPLSKYQLVYWSLLS